MFHLFNKTCVYPDTQFPMGWSSDIIISKFTDYNYVDNLEDIKRNLGMEIFDSYESFTGKRTDIEVFEDIYNRSVGGFRIFADYQTIAIFVCKTLKLLFPKMSELGAWLIYNATCSFYYSTGILYSALLHTTTTVASHKDCASSYKQLGIDEFAKLYRNTRFTGTSGRVEAFRKEIKPYISNEYKLACYLNGDKSFDENLKTQLHKFIMRGIKENIEEIKVYAMHKNIGLDVTKPIADVNREHDLLLCTPVHMYTTDHVHEILPLLTTELADKKSYGLKVTLENIMLSTTVIDNNNIDHTIDFLIKNMTEQDEYLNHTYKLNNFDRVNIVLFNYLLMSYVKNDMSFLEEFRY